MHPGRLSGPNHDHGVTPVQHEIERDRAEPLGIDVVLHGMRHRAELFDPPPQELGRERSGKGLHLSLRHSEPVIGHAPCNAVVRFDDIQSAHLLVGRGHPTRDDEEPTRGDRSGLRTQEVRAEREGGPRCRIVIDDGVRRLEGNSRSAARIVIVDGAVGAEPGLGVLPKHLLLHLPERRAVGDGSQNLKPGSLVRLVLLDQAFDHLVECLIGGIHQRTASPTRR